MEKDIGKLKKNDITDIVIRIDDFGGKKGLTIREFTTSDRYTGFTKSGTRISAESFKTFKEIINSIDEKEFEGVPTSDKSSGPSNDDPKDEDNKPAEEKPKKKSKKKEIEITEF